MPRLLSSGDSGFEAAFQALMSARRTRDPDVEAVTADIIADVHAHGDAAVIELTARFDRIRITPRTLAVSIGEKEAEYAKLSAEGRRTLELAATRIRAYHERQMPQNAHWKGEAGASWRHFGAVIVAGNWRRRRC